MTRRFTAHEARPTRNTGPKAPAAVVANATQPGKAPKLGATDKVKEAGGPSGPEPTRYGDWERKGICVDF